MVTLVRCARGVKSNDVIPAYSAKNQYPTLVSSASPVVTMTPPVSATMVRYIYVLFVFGGDK